MAKRNFIKPTGPIETAPVGSEILIIKPLRLSLSAGARFPVITRDYSSSTHRYSNKYVFPDSYTIFVDAFPGEDIINIIDDPEPPQGGSPARPIKILRLKVPLDTVSVSFTINEVNAGFSNTKSNRIVSLTRSSNTNVKPPFDLFRWEVNVPRLGPYDVIVKFVNKVGGGPLNTKRITLKESLVVSIGDSSASGQGNPDVPGSPEKFDPDIKWWEVFIPPLLVFELGKAAVKRMRNFIVQNFTTFSRLKGLKLDMDPDPIWLEKEAYRSLRSGPALAARRMENIQEGSMITFLSFARTGSEIQDGLLKGRTKDGNLIDDWIGNIGQVQECLNTVGKRRIDALLISIGVNDIGVSGVLKDLVAKDLGNDDAVERQKVEKEAEEKLAKIPASFELLAKELQKLNIRHVYLTEYPIGLFDKNNGHSGEGCGIFDSILELDYNVEDARLVKKLAERLNTVLKEEAKKRGWFFITGIAQRFRGSGYCTSDEVRCFIQAEESLIIQGDTEGTIHPNARGHRIYAEQIAAMVKENTLNKPDLDVFQDEPATPGSVVI